MFKKLSLITIALTSFANLTIAHADYRNKLVIRNSLNNDKMTISLVTNSCMDTFDKTSVILKPKESGTITFNVNDNPKDTCKGKEKFATFKGLRLEKDGHEVPYDHPHLISIHRSGDPKCVSNYPWFARCDWDNATQAYVLDLTVPSGSDTIKV